jgi:hypothetical protein
LELDYVKLERGKHTMQRANTFFFTLFLMLIFRYEAGAQIVISQVDDFEDGTLQGWRDGNNSPNPPTNIANGGPGGAGDNYLQDVSSGSGGAGGKLVMFNTTQWTGDYTGAGVTYIRMHMNNLGGANLEMRLALDGDGGRFSSTDGVLLPSGSGWQIVEFPIMPSDWTSVGGTNVNATLGDVSDLRILHNTSPSWQGIPIAATLGVDNITASDSPVSVRSKPLANSVLKHRLMQNYPNPFNPSTRISYTVSKRDFVNVRIYDILGKEIQTLFSGFQEANTYSLNFDASEFSSGIYFYKLQVGGDFVEIRKMLFLR